MKKELIEFAQSQVKSYEKSLYAICLKAHPEWFTYVAATYHGYRTLIYLLERDEVSCEGIVSREYERFSDNRLSTEVKNIYAEGFDEVDFFREFDDVLDTAREFLLKLKD